MTDNHDTNDHDTATMSTTGDLWTGAFWKATAERTIRTFAQTAGGVLAADVAGLLDVDWAQTGSVAGLAALLTVCTCVAAGVTDPVTGASFGPEAPVREGVAQ